MQNLPRAGALPVALSLARRLTRFHATTGALALSATVAVVLLVGGWALQPGTRAQEAGAALPVLGSPAGTNVSPAALPPESLSTAHLSTGCSNPGAASPSQQLTSGGLTRTFRVHAPESLERPAAVVINLHGRYANAEFQERYSGFVPISDREGFLLVSADGTGAIRGWSAGATTGSTVDDVKFLGDLIAYVGRTYCVDIGRVFVAGMSNGAFMAALAGCKIAEVSGIAMVAGTAGPSTPCRGPLPVIAFHGTADTIVPFNAGTVRNTMSYPGAAPLMAKWSAHNRCTGTAHDDTGQPFAHLVYVGCEAATEFVVVYGGGHTWPGAVPVPDLGKTSTGISAAEEIWRFFSTIGRR